MNVFVMKPGSLESDEFQRWFADAWKRAAAADEAGEPHELTAIVSTTAEESGMKRYVNSIDDLKSYLEGAFESYRENPPTNDYQVGMLRVLMIIADLIRFDPDPDVLKEIIAAIGFDPKSCDPVRDNSWIDVLNTPAAEITAPEVGAS